MRNSSVYVLLTLAFLALLIFSKRPQVPHARHRRYGPGRIAAGGRRLVVRNTLVSGGGGSGSKHEPAAFDPVVTRYELRREDRAWERQQYEQRHPPSAAPAPPLAMAGQVESDLLSQPQSGEDYWEDEQFINDDEHFNITHRLITLFPLLDNNPQDHFVSLQELQDWHLAQGLKILRHRSDRDFEAHDTNHDGRITFSEYLPELTPQQISDNSMEQGGAGWWKEQFRCADEDGDEALNAQEYLHFLNPEESGSPKMRMWLRKQAITENDKDKDGKLSWSEFDASMFEVLREGGLSPDQKAYPEVRRHLLSRQRFQELDSNSDGFLTENELETVMAELHPGEAFYAKQQAEQVLQEADDNKDGKLSIEEILAHPYSFYNTAYEDDEDDYAHLELR